jgi:carboxypeptidase PM20D1
VDTKASLFCIFTALEELIASGYTPAGDVYIASSCTEEISGPGAPATVEYLKEQGVKPSLVLDEGGMILEAPIAGVKGLYAMVGVVEKGYADVKFTARSNGGHASAPGKNTPLVRLGRFMADIEDNSPFQRQMSPTMEEMFRRLAPNMGFGLKTVLTNLWLFKPILLKVLPAINASAGAMTQTTLAFTTAKGSDGLNVLPQEAYVTGNMRLIQHQPGAESIAAVTKIAEQYGIETQVLYEDAPCPVVSYESKQFRLIEAITAEIYPGVQVTPYVMTGGTDAKFYKDLCPNCIRFAPLYIDQQQYGSVHGLNENIFQGALPMGVDFYKGVIEKMAEIQA